MISEGVEFSATVLNGRVKMTNKEITDDIGELKNALHKLRENEIRYRSLFDSANDGIFLLEKHTIIDCNQKFLTIFGCTKEQTIGQTPY